MLRVTAGAAATSADGAAPDAAVVEDGEKEAYLRSLPSGRGPATVSSHSWSRSPMEELNLRAFNART